MGVALLLLIIGLELGGLIVFIIVRDAWRGIQATRERRK